MKFTVDRKTWYRGKGPGKSKLLTEDGLRCCIGFVGQQCGIKDKDLLSKAAVHRLSNLFRERFPKWLQAGEFATEAYAINDNEHIDDTEREAELQKLFKAHGDEIEFTD